MRQKPRPEEEQVLLPEGVIPALIDKDVFESVQRRLDQNKQNAVRNSKYTQHMLLRAGLILCGHCGTNMYVRHMKPSRTHPYNQIVYYCPMGSDKFNPKCKWNSINCEIIDAEVWNRAIPLLEDFSLIAKRLERIKASDPAATELPPILRGLEDVDRRRKNFMAMLNGKRELDADTIDMIQAQLAKLGKEREKLELEHRTVENMHLKWTEVEQKLEGFRAWCENMAGHLEDATSQEKRTALELLGTIVQIWRHDNDPRYTIDFAPARIVSVNSPFWVR